MKNKLSFLIVIILFVVFGIISSKASNKRNRIIEHIQHIDVPVSGWEVLNDIELKKKVLIALDPNSISFKNYINNKKRIVTLVYVYHQNKRWGAHDPTLCYTTQGWDIYNKPKKVSVKNGTENIELIEFRIKKGTIKKIVRYYWFSNGFKITHSRQRQMISMIKNGIIKGYAESGFVRFSTIIDQLDDNVAINSMDNFIIEFTYSLLDNKLNIS